MLKRITLENFFSFGEPTTIELNRDINVLVGINASGKSNFLKAIRLLYEGVAGEGLENILLKEWGGLDNVVNVSGKKNDYVRLSFFIKSDLMKEWFYNYELTIYNHGTNFYSLVEQIFEHRENKTPVLVLYRKERYCKYAFQMNEDGSVARWMDVENDGYSPISGTESIFKQRHVFFVGDTSVIHRNIKKCVMYGYFDLSIKSPTRQPNNFSTEESLLPNGENLNTIIQKLKNNHSLEYDKIEELLRDINPNFKDITFNLFGSKSYLLLREKNLANAISIEHISDGTLRYLLLLAIFYNPNRGSVVCIDEPEMGLHPDMVSTIAKAIKHASKTTQMFIATHSPLLLNEFELENVLIFEKDKNNQTVVIKKTEKDFEDWNDDYLVGQLWLNGQLGGKRW